ncbi:MULTISPECIES: EAL domain-containing protein [Psychrilyobacter]|uniref:EAL domain-containing protein n=1 Tax=Psychrilyobacter piezotolerans TaxID=2293438 RepID=A0ABX9KJX3_9FUSO|nr:MULTISPECIES: EAL domain-containing protein [Psychrilyobacter]MCS5420505.1 EAL domain-containing protein [Psychrilyobacter sp. S5]NDI76889.1 EAL domain-containing protein [Psychrilyobacter piezotolerans]RDE65168.1 EAL domain-containing protein [Psychrilyobacter sp. S5]REI42738.1 EAL domain-containing protein [Psychrilyobacter piezotolerans]
MIKLNRKFLFSLMLVFISLIVQATNYISSGIYSEDEINYIKSLQNSGIRMGVHTGSPYIDLENPDDSLVYKYKDLLEEFFHMDVKVETDSWENLYEMLEREEIDLLLNFTLSEERKDKINLSIPIHSDKLYVITTNKNIPLRSFDDLEGKELTVISPSAYSEYLKKFKREKNLNFRLREVHETAEGSASDYIVVSKEDIYDKTEPIFELGRIDPIGLGIAKSQPMLKSVIDKALEFSHREKFLKLLEYEKNKRRKRVFHNFLNQQEIDYLNNKKSLKVIFQSDFYPTSYYDGAQKKYDGSFVQMMEEISQFWGIPLEVSNENLNSEEADLRGMLFTEERENIYKFTKSLTYKDILIVAAGPKKIGVEKKVNKVGVVKTDISAASIRKYLPKDTEITEFPHSQTMVDALKDKEIDSCVMDADMFRYLQQARFDINFYKVDILDKLPFAIAVKKDDEILIGILNKVMDNFLDYKRVEDEFLSEMSFFKTIKADEQKKNRKSLSLVISLFGFFTAAFFTGFKYRTNKKLKNLAYYDHLTTALNRVSFKEAMNKIDFKRDRGLGMYIDLNDFKVINDNYGHHAGDMILKESVSRLQKIFCKDTVYRLAGDEFFVFHRDASVDEGIKLAENALAELNKSINILETTFNIGASIGICELHEKIDNMDYFLHKADIAMFAAKKNGSGSIVVASKELVREFEESKNLERDFKVALQKNEIIPYFQPKVNLQTNKIIGLEALARWVHPQKGIISPITFIPLAEEIGLVYKLDMKIAELTIKTVKDWQERGIIDKGFKASFNVSAQTFGEIDVYEQIKYLLDKYDVPGEAVEIELTESVFIKKFSKILGELNSIKDKLGTSVALDDFTAGYSSLRELGKLNIDSLKFDRSLLESVKENSVKGKKIYRTLIRLCSDMDYISVAEGIEEASESDFLKKEGVTHAQGFFFGKPMPEKDFVNLLNKGL